MIFQKVCFFPDITEICIFHKILGFLCSRCVKRVVYSASLLKCTDMCKHRFGVQLLKNPLLCSSTLQRPYSGDFDPESRRDPDKSHRKPAVRSKNMALFYSFNERWVLENIDQ
jgi:hypothetical protein